jgi:SMC interacting uncharacterized protein involved in chromosome segregation
MENLIKNLDEILESVQQLKESYQHLTDENKKLEVQLSHLKVETDRYKNEISELKKELEEKAEAEINTTLSTTDKTAQEGPDVHRQHQNVTNERIRLQLDGFIEEIDQCIQIIQAKQ